MRMYLKRAVQWVLAIALLQVAVYYWTIGSKARTKARQMSELPAEPHPYLESTKDRQDGTCSYQTCGKVKPGVLNIHLVPHSHIDVGWLKSVDEYYTGKGDGDFGDTHYSGCVRCILNATIQELLKNPARTFIFAEMKYFARFWNEASAKEIKSIQDLISQRRLELVNGGWVMSDAGVTVYKDIIDQHTLGFDFIREALGPCAQTRTAWHVDQFGHSSEHASIFAQMGYDSLFVGRISDLDKEKRKASKDLEMVWLTSPVNQGLKSSLFTHVTYDGYYAPQGFVLENLEKGVFSSSLFLDKFISGLQRRAYSFQTNHLLVPMGSDFGYSRPDLWFQNMDDALKQLQKNPNREVNLLYSTPSCYTYHVNKELQTKTKSKESLLVEKLNQPSKSKSSKSTQSRSLQPSLKTKVDDFLPYITNKVWAGFFTTRGGLKRHIWEAGQVLRSCKQLAIFTGLEGTFNKIQVLRDAVAVMQHHDAITGTQKMAVLGNYHLLLSNATQTCEKVMSDAYLSLWKDGTTDQEMEQPQFCFGLNISSCEITEESDEFLVTVYNGLTWNVNFPLRFPVDLGSYEILADGGNILPCQLVPVPEGIQSIPERPLTSFKTELTFVSSLPPLSVSTFHVKSKASQTSVSALVFAPVTDKYITIENEHLKLIFNRATGLLAHITNKDSGVKANVSQEFLHYSPPFTAQSEGAYVFCPGDEPAVPIRAGKPATIKVIKGDIVQEVHQNFSKDVTQVVRLYKGSKFAEFHWTVGRLDTSYTSGRNSINVVSRFTSSLASADVFYTDSNGRDMIKRKLESWRSMPEYKISGNYYPITSRMFIKDEKAGHQLTVLPDRPQGGSSLSPGALELMVHRRSITDDGLGMQEPLNDVGADRQGIFYTGKHYLYLDHVKNSDLVIRRQAWQTHLAPTVMFTELSINNNVATAVEQPYLKQHVFLNPGALPDKVHLLTLDRILENDTTLLLLRLEHALEVEMEKGNQSEPVAVELERLFQPFDIVSAEETTLGGNFNPAETTRMEWVSENAWVPKEMWPSDFTSNMTRPFKVLLKPMAIRTFRVKISSSTKIK